MTAHTPTPDPALHLRADGISFSYPGQAADRRVQIGRASCRERV